MRIEIRLCHGYASSVLHTKILLFLLLNLLFSAQQDVVLAQEAPMAEVKKFDYTTNYRTNVCDRQRLIFGNEIEIRNALRGLNLTVHATDYAGTSAGINFYLTEEGKLPSVYPGVVQVLLDELARRAGFTWRNSFVSTTPLDPEEDGDKTWSDILQWGTANFDIVADYYYATPERKALGISFPEGWQDGSLTLITKMKTKKGSFRFWSFIQPFTYDVWITIIVTIIVSGLLYNVLERLNESADQGNIEKKPLTCAFLAMLTFTGHFEFKPKSSTARLLSFSLSFFSLLVASAYTANLASFLLTSNIPYFAVTSMDDLANQGESVCAYAGTPWVDHIRDNYPGAKVVLKQGEGEIMQGLKDDDCAGAATGQTAFDLFQRDPILNNDCSLAIVGRPLVLNRAGFATIVDSGSKCTSLITHVIDLHMLEMKDDGTFNRIYYEYLNKKGPLLCSEVRSSKPDNTRPLNSEDTDVKPLKMVDIGGVFGLHAFLTFVSLCIALRGKCQRNRWQKLNED